MLLHLQIRDFAIIEAAELEFGPGLTVLTGETGAGKSILVDALSLVAGGRAGAEVVRHGAQRAEVSATFSLAQSSRELRDWLEAQAVAADTELTIRRVVQGDGRSRAYLNTLAVPLQLLREAGSHLIDIHGQHEFQSLLRPTTHRELLDEYGRLQPFTDQVGIAHRVWLSILNRTLQLETQAHDREGRLALLKHQCQELEALALAEGELERLAEERGRLAHRGRLAEGAHAALGQLYEDEQGSAHATASRALAALRPLEGLDPKIGAVLPLVDSAVIQMREAARELSQYLTTLDVDPARQDQLERRLAQIEDLARKHRITPAQLPERAQQLVTEMRSVESAEADLSGLRKDLAAALATFQERARQLSGRRGPAARGLAKEVSSRMQTLGMSGGRFQVEVTPITSGEPAAHGLDDVEFRVSANPGQPPRPIAKVASGGELSRLSLAVQVACAAQSTRCMVFDEVDAGIGGAVAEIIGRELRALGRRSQVLCVTHLPQVASQGHQHLRVSKWSDGRQTKTGVGMLVGEERVEELARMLGGLEVSTKAREHAREMLQGAESADAQAEASVKTSSEKRSSAGRSGRRE